MNTVKSRRGTGQDSGEFITQNRFLLHLAKFLHSGFLEDIESKEVRIRPQWQHAVCGHRCRHALALRFSRGSHHWLEMAEASDVNEMVCWAVLLC